VSSSSRGQAGRAALDQLDDQRRRHGALDGGAAGLALALPVVAVADREQRALDVDAEEAGGARPHLRGVHVAAEPLGHQRAAHLSPGGATPTVPSIGSTGSSTAGRCAGRRR
jgi:hypothetical protein